MVLVQKFYIILIILQFITVVNKCIIMAKRSNNGEIKRRNYNESYLMLGFIPSETLPIKPI